VNTDIYYEGLVEMVSRYAASGADPVWETCDRELSLPPPPPWWAVIVPGLIDGINPCAFATIIFFVSYLSIIRRRGQEILMVGIAFTLAVFLAYLGFGMVLRELFAGLIDLVGPILRPILNILTALLCLVLAILGFDDFRKARRGQLKDATLQLPHKLRMWINARIRNSMRSEALVTASFVSGVVVSLVELACTGQVYVPIIQGLSNPEHRAQSTLDLVVYCLAFTVPLIVVFALSYVGTDSKHFTRFLTRYAAPIKLLMTFVFLSIGLWLIYDVLRIWGLGSIGGRG
jgi:cytochrome c biogenesis protein CcdA